MYLFKALVPGQAKGRPVSLSPKIMHFFFFCALSKGFTSNLLGSPWQRFSVGALVSSRFLPDCR